MSQDQYLQSVVSPVKDVEGLNHQFLFNLYHKSDPTTQPNQAKGDAVCFSIRFISPTSLQPPASSRISKTSATAKNGREDQAPEGTVKSVLPCTPLAVVKVLEHLGVYNKMLDYGDRARGKVITIINRCVCVN